MVDPEAARGADFILPGYAETKDLKPLSGPGKTSPPAYASPSFLGKPKNTTVSARGKLCACAQLTTEDLDGSRWKRISALRKFGNTW